MFPMINIHSIKIREITECMISIFVLFSDAGACAVGLSKPYSQRIPFIE